MSSVFTQILAGEIPGHFVWQDDLVMAIMTIAPVAKGHLLVIPKQEVNHWDDMPEETAAHIMLVSQKIAKAIKQQFPCKRVGMIIAGIEVPHTHLHLIPINALSDFDFSKAYQAETTELEQSAEKIKSALIDAGFQQANC